MIAKLCDLVRPYLELVPYADRVAGLVKTHTDPVIGGEGAKPVKYPIRFEGGEYSDLVPDDSKLSTLYIEDFGTRIVGHLKVKSTIRVVGWISARLPTDVAQLAAAYVLQQVPERPKNTGIFQDLRLTPVRILSVEDALFARYTYREGDLQFLLSPNVAFGVDFECDYTLNPACLPTITKADVLSLNAAGC